MNMYYVNGVDARDGYTSVRGDYKLQREYGRDHDGTAFCGAWVLRCQGFLLGWDFLRDNIADMHGMVLENPFQKSTKRPVE